VIGLTISHYRVVEKLAAEGIVYNAELREWVTFVTFCSR